MLTTVELSINGQEYVGLRQRIKYVDPYFRDLMWSANPLNSLSLHPSSGSVNGGTVVTILGTPAYVRTIIHSFIIHNHSTQSKTTGTIRKRRGMSVW